MIPLRCFNNPSLDNDSNLSFIPSHGKIKQKNINLSNMLVCDDATMIERLSINSGLHSTQRNTKTSKGSKKKTFSKGDRFKILNQQLYTDSDFSSNNNRTMGDECNNYLQQYDIVERCNTTQTKYSKNFNRPNSQENGGRFKIKNDNATFLNRNYNNIPTPAMNSFVNTTPTNANKQRPQTQLQQQQPINDKENLDTLQRLQLFIKPSYIKQRDYLSIDVRSRNQSIGDVNQNGKYQVDSDDTTHHTQHTGVAASQNIDRYHYKRNSNSCMGKYTIDVPQTQSVQNSQTIQFQERGIRSITPSILSTSTHAATLTLNKSLKGKKGLSQSKNGSLLNQSSYKKKIKILNKKESKSPKPQDIIPFSVSNSYSRNNPLRISKNSDLKVISILGAYDQVGLGNFIFNKKQFKTYLKTLNFKTPQEEQQMIKYMFIYFKQWQQKINRNIDMIKLQLFSIKVEVLEEESVDIQRYIRKKANQAKRIKKCISVLLNYTKSKRDSRKLKQINQKCSEYDSLLKTINIIHTLKIRVEGYLVNKIQKSSPQKTRQPTPLTQVTHMDQSALFDSRNIRYRDSFLNKQVNTDHLNITKEDDDTPTHSIHKHDSTPNQYKRNSSISSNLKTATNYDQNPSRAQSRRINMDLTDDDFEISHSRINSEGINLYDKHSSFENQQIMLQQQQQQQQQASSKNNPKVTPENNITPPKSTKSNNQMQQDNSDFYKISYNQQSNQFLNSNDNACSDGFNFQKDIINVKNLKQITINNEDENQRNTINQASIDNMNKSGSVNTNYQGSFIGNSSSSDKQEKQGQKLTLNKISLNSQIVEEVEVGEETPKRSNKQISVAKEDQNQNGKKVQQQFESLERVIKDTIAEQSLSIKHKNIFQNYIDSIKIPLEDLQKQGDDATHIFSIFNDLMSSFEEKIIDHTRNCTDLNKWDILLQYMRDFAQLIDETVKMGSELMKLTQSKALPLQVTNRAVVYLQEAQEKYREVQGKVKDSMKELVTHMWDMIESGIHLNSNDKEYEDIFKFMADIRDSVKQSQVNDYQNKEKLSMIDDVAQFLNELYKISFGVQSMVSKKQLEFVDSPSFSIIKDIKNKCHEFKMVYKNMMQKLLEIGDNQLVTNISKQNTPINVYQRKSLNQSINSNSITTADLKQDKFGNIDTINELMGFSLIEKQCEEIEDLFEINRWFVSNNQDIDNLIIFEDPSNIPETYPANEEGKRRFFSETSIGVGVILQLRENAEDIVDISGSQNLTNIIQTVKLSSEKYQKIADISIAAAELCNLQNFISPLQQHYNSTLKLDQQTEKKDTSSADSISNIYQILDKLKIQFNNKLDENEWFVKFFRRLINGTLYFDFIAVDYPYLCENMHSILSEYSHKTKFSIPSTDLFYKRKSVVEQKLESVRKQNHLCENGIAPAILFKLSFIEQRIAFAVNLFGSNNFVLPNGTLLCKILEAFFERIVHAKPFSKLSEQFEKLRVFMLKGIEIICKEKEVLCSKSQSNSNSSISIQQESEEDLVGESKQRKRKSSTSFYYQQQIKDNEPSSKSTNATINLQNANHHPHTIAQSAVKPQNRSYTPTSSGFKKPLLKELKFEQEDQSVQAHGKNKGSSDFSDKILGKMHYYDNILEEAENLSKHCSLFIPSREDENSQHQKDGDYVLNFSIRVYEDFLQLCSRYLLAKRDKVNIYSNLQLRVKWIAPYNEELSIFQQKYAFIQKYILPPDSDSSQEVIIEYTKHINQVFHKNGPIYYKYDFQQFQSYLQLFIDAPASNFLLLITLENDPSCVLFQGNLENQKINTLLPINDVYTNVKMSIICKDISQPVDNGVFPLKSVRSSVERSRIDSVFQEESEQQQISLNLPQSSQHKKQQNKMEQFNSNMIVNLNNQERPFIRHKSQHIFLMRAQKVTQLKISNLNYNLRDEELFKIFYRSNSASSFQNQQKSSILLGKKQQLEVYAILNESQVIFRRKNISLDKSIYFTQNSSTIQEWTILQSYLKPENQANSQVIDFYVKINHVEEGSFYVYDKNNYYSIKSSLLIKQEAVLDEIGIPNKEENKEAIIQNVNNLLGEKYWHAFSIVGNNEFVERSRLTSQPHILKNLQ